MRDVFVGVCYLCIMCAVMCAYHSVGLDRYSASSVRHTSAQVAFLSCLLASVCMHVVDSCQVSAVSGPVGGVVFN